MASRTAWLGTHGIEDGLGILGPASGGRRMPLFSSEEGSEISMNMLARGTYSELEIRSAQVLSGIFGGLPLALYLMGVQIRTKRERIEHSLLT